MNEESQSNWAAHDEATPQPPSQLFTVRIWSAVSAQGVVSWRGKVQAVPGGAWRYFQEWEALTSFLQTQSGAVTIESQSPL